MAALLSKSDSWIPKPCTECASFFEFWHCPKGKHLYTYPGTQVPRVLLPVLVLGTGYPGSQTVRTVRSES
eukprot:1026386-Rhodomonas_salina.3